MKINQDNMVNKDNEGEEFKFFKRGYSKLFLYIFLMLFSAMLALWGYWVYTTSGNIIHSAVLWLLSVGMIGLTIVAYLCSVRLYQDRIELRYWIKKTVYLKDVSTLDIEGNNLAFKDSTGKVLTAIVIQYIGPQFTDMLKFIKKHNPHIELGMSFIPDGITLE